MKAKDLAAELLKNPELEVRLEVYTDASSTGTTGDCNVQDFEISETEIRIIGTEGE